MFALEFHYVHVRCFGGWREIKIHVTHNALRPAAVRETLAYVCALAFFIFPASRSETIKNTTLNSREAAFEKQAARDDLLK